MRARALWIVEPGRVEIRQEELPPLAPDQVRVRTDATAISAGSERLFYQGRVPAGMPVDSALPGMSTEVDYPLKYGYCCVGRVEEIGAEIDPDWHDRRVFAFRPHQSCFHLRPAELIPLDPSIGFEDAVFLPNVETAVNFLHDGAPLIGERVVVHGLGIVGQLTAALLSLLPLAVLVGLDPIAQRREFARARGADATLDPSDPAVVEELTQALAGDGGLEGADLSYELSGVPSALNLAIATTGFAGRIIIGSWYGSRGASLELGAHFHRNRIRLVSSQVSSLDPVLRGRWSKERRLRAALRWLPHLSPSELITHRLPFERGAEAYQLLEDPSTALGIILTYDGSN